MTEFRVDDYACLLYRCEYCSELHEDEDGAINCCQCVYPIDGWYCPWCGHLYDDEDDFVEHATKACGELPDDLEVIEPPAKDCAGQLTMEATDED